jgi:hypothetical protein
MYAQKFTPLLECNQQTRICEDDSTLSCHPINGVYFCCAGPHVAKIPPAMNFVPEFQQHQQMPGDGGNFCAIKLHTLNSDPGINPTTTAATTRSSKPPDEECKLACYGVYK